MRSQRTHPLSRRALVAAGSAALASLAFVRGPARAAQYAWKFGDDFGADHPVNVRLVEAFSRIRAESGGRVDIKAYPDSALGGTSSMVTQLRIGALELMATGGGVFDAIVPLASIEIVAFAFHEKKTAFAAMDGDLGQLIRSNFPSRGFVGFERLFDNGFREFTTSTRPIRNAEDIAGLKLRVSPGNLYFDTIRSLGASPAVLVPADAYTALQTRLVDGQETPLALMASLRYYEVQKYCSLSNHMWTPAWFLANREKWEALPRDLQEIVRKHIDNAALLQRKDNAIFEASLRDKLSRQGLLFNNVDTASLKSKLVASGYYGRWRKEYGAAAWETLEKYAGPLA